MKIYVIIKESEMSNYICAVTTDSDNAKYLLELANCDGYEGEARIEVFDDYSELTSIAGNLYKVCCLCDNSGNIVWHGNYREHFYNNEKDYALRFEEEELHGTIADEKSKNGNDYYVCLVVAKTAEEAEKIGVEMIQNYKDKKI